MSDLSDWYWLADDGRLYASARDSLISPSDEAYRAWLVTPYLPTRWPSDDAGQQSAAALAAVLTANGLAYGLAGRRAAKLEAADAEAERQRLRWITPGAGQAMTYARKVEEAKGVTAASKPADCPMLAASLGIDGDTLQAVAATVLAMDAAWARIGAAIEARRLILKRDIAAAGSAEALAAIDINSDWPEAA